MRILFCIPDIDQGGSAKSLSILIERLYKKHDLAILSFSRPNPEKKIAGRYRELGIKIIVFPWGWLPISVVGHKIDHTLAKNCCESLKPKLPLIQKLVQNYDAVCFNSYMSVSLAPELPQRIPKYLIAREVLDESGAEFDSVAELLRAHIKRAVAIGPIESGQLGRMGIPNRIVFNSASDTPVYTPMPTGKDFKFGIFSQIVATKGLHTLFMATAASANFLRSANASLHIFGTGDKDYAESLIKAAADQEISDIFRLEGWTDNVKDRMRAMRVIVRPDNTGSPWGRDIIEAMSMGRPVLATGKRKIFIRDGQNGWLISPESPLKLAQKLLTIISDPAGHIEEISQNAFAFARRNFDPDINSSQIEEYLFSQ